MVFLKTSLLQSRQWRHAGQTYQPLTTQSGPIVRNIINCRYGFSYYWMLLFTVKIKQVINQIKRLFFVINLIFMILNRDTVVFITWLELQ